MQRKYKFLYRLIKKIPFKTKTIVKLRHLLGFYNKGNTLIILHKDGTKLVNPLKLFDFLDVRASGICSGNKVILSEHQKKGTCLEFNFWNGSNNIIEIGTDNLIVMKAHIQGHNGRATIGNNVYICDSVLYMYCSGKTTFRIGDNNLFSEKITFWAGEGHSVIDPTTKQVTNTGGDISIGNNNWICMNVCFLKRAKLGDGCVVGYGAVVCNDLSQENNCVLAGNPARVVKRDILWAEKEPWNYDGKLYR